MRLQQAWQKADLFRRIPRDLTEATATGAIVSIVCVAVMLVLFVGELVTYISPRLQSDMVVAVDKEEGSRLKVNLDMTFHKLPCAFISLDIVDILHNHEMNSMNFMKKTRIDANGNVIGGNGREDENVANDEGCKLEGYILVTKVPGNFHISSHSQFHMVRNRFPQGINVAHTIHHMSFGDNDARTFSKTAQVSPLDGTANLDERPTIYQYAVEVVPTIYEGTFGDTTAYQFTALQNKVPVVDPQAQMAVVQFQYQLAPISVKYSSTRVPFTHFITYICAIIGGVYTVAGLVCRFLYTSTAHIQKRFMGKGD